MSEYPTEFSPFAVFGVYECISIYPQSRSLLSVSPALDPLNHRNVNARRAGISSESFGNTGVGVDGVTERRVHGAH